MHNFSTTNADKEPTISNNIAIIESAYNNEAYHYWVNATMMEDSDDTDIPTYHIGDMTNGLPAYWELPNIADETVRSYSVGFYVRRHGEWRDGVLSVTPHYSVTTADGDIRWRVSIAKVANLTASDVTTTDLTRDVPVTADVITTVDLSDALLSPTSGVDRRYIGVMVSIGRVESHEEDTCTGDVHLYGVDLVYKESRRVVGDKL